MKKTRKAYEQDLNKLHNPQAVLELTEHCWAGKDKRPTHQRRARRLAEMGLYGTVLKEFDPIAFNVGYNEWKG